MEKLNLGALIWVHKPLGNAYQITDIKEYWIPNQGGDALTARPENEADYHLSRIYYYYLRTNNTGKRIEGSELTHAGERFIRPYDKQLVLDYHQKEIDKITAKNPTLGTKELAKIEQIKGYMIAVDTAQW
jgi:sarcosine oxidase delta subunit